MKNDIEDGLWQMFLDNAINYLEDIILATESEN